MKVLCLGWSLYPLMVLPASTGMLFVLRCLVSLAELCTSTFSTVVIYVHHVIIDHLEVGRVQVLNARDCRVSVREYMVFSSIVSSRCAIHR